MSQDSNASATQILTKLRFRHLQLLELLGRTRNLRVAAEHMHITQPAATKILSDLEAMFGAPLFERLPREMRPTDLGALSVRYASTTLSNLGKFSGEFSTLKNGGYGHLTVGFIPASAAQLVTASIKEIQRRRPRLIIKLVEQSSDQLAIWLEERRLDVMIGRPTEPRHQALFHVVELLAEPARAVVGQHHPLLKQQRMEIADVGEWPWILYPQGTAMRQLFEETFAAAGMVAPVGIVETPSIFSTLELLQATDMISLQPKAAMDKYVKHGLLGYLDLPIRRTLSNYSVITRKDEATSQAMNEFIAILLEIAAQCE
ncbi:LysR family transcriptional regulator [Caballeronia cordobensis]|uniref:LysR family transcriptional regulator n=1 Tax=Caballeronia cordobensis TaxID=1353886 RepID=A0A158GRI1_CABCO|nr:LysR family transcriptional regulator [Caballeronia cordobensis]BAO90495.1 LysR family transcriptional regulator [Burkholderia sp. RPE67]SAL34688.1 LysR family transcriptional regulator [Caballeronia cordobensis]